MRRGKNALLVSEYINKALQFIEQEQTLLHFRITHPESFPPKPAVQLPKLFWADKFSKRDLLELLTALFFAGAIHDSGDRKATFVSLVKFFEIGFNIKLSRAYNERDLLLLRTNKMTFFLDMLKEKLVQNANSRK